MPGKKRSQGSLLAFEELPKIATEGKETDQHEEDNDENKSNGCSEITFPLALQNAPNIGCRLTHAA